MDYPEGTTHKNETNENDVSGYKIVYEKLFWCIYIERVYFHCNYQDKWQKGAFSKSYYNLTEI